MKEEIRSWDSVTITAKQSIPAMEMVREQYIDNLSPKWWNMTPASKYESISDRADVMLLM